MTTEQASADPEGGERTEADMRDEVIAAYETEIVREAMAWSVTPDGSSSEARLTEALARINRAQREAERKWLRRQRSIPAKVRREVLNDPCAYCGDFATDVDHILPVSRGGTRDRENLAPACSTCNWEKLDFTPDEWRAWRLERGWSWPPPGFVARLAEAVRAAAQDSRDEVGGDDSCPTAAP